MWLRKGSEVRMFSLKKRSRKRKLNWFCVWGIFYHFLISFYYFFLFHLCVSEVNDKRIKVQFFLASERGKKRERLTDICMKSIRYLFWLFYSGVLLMWCEKELRTEMRWNKIQEFTNLWYLAVAFDNNRTRIENLFLKNCLLIN